MVIKIGNKTIGENQPVFVVAEIGINHNGDIETAKKLIMAAKESGADAVKFQTYLTEKRVQEGTPIYKILKQCELSEDQTKVLYTLCRKEGIVFFSTPFDKESVDFLDGLGVSVFKIASSDIINKPLIDHIVSKHKPVILSRGMATEKEIRAVIKIFKKNKIPHALLHCVSAYPTRKNDANLSTINTLRKKFDCPIGYSDHTFGIKIPTLSVALGACIIEKHFTLDKTMEGPDHNTSCEPSDFKKLVKEIEFVKTVLGDGRIRRLECEEPILQYRRKKIGF